MHYSVFTHRFYLPACGRDIFQIRKEKCSAVWTWPSWLTAVGADWRLRCTFFLWYLAAVVDWKGKRMKLKTAEMKWEGADEGREAKAWQLNNQIHRRLVAERSVICVFIRVNLNFLCSFKDWFEQTNSHASKGKAKAWDVDEWPRLALLRSDLNWSQSALAWLTTLEPTGVQTQLLLWFGFFDSLPISLLVFSQPVNLPDATVCKPTLTFSISPNNRFSHVLPPTSDTCSTREHVH